jgi:nitrite reductase/ring-hydroxylating ferredoxin subunit
VTGKVPTVSGSPQETKTSSTTSGSTQVTEQEQVGRYGSSLTTDEQNQAAATDPFVWWSTTSGKTAGQTPGTFARSATKRSANYDVNARRKSSVKGRRKVVLGLLAGTAVVGITGIGGISFAHFIESTRHSQAGKAQSVLSSQTQATQGTTQSPTQGSQNTPTGSSAPNPHPSPTVGTQPTPTQGSTPPPKPTPTPPPHTGTVIGSTSQPTNSGKNFTNPADGRSSTLVHLANGNFVACERQCTHQGVNVNYDSGSQKLVCPAHGAVFDPANGFNLIQGPGNGPLPGVSIRVNADGTITTG